MTSQQLETFMMVAKHLSYRKAAELLFITQPAVTKQIMLLEKELGMELFARSKRDVALTPVGELFYDFTQQTSESFENFYMRARQQQSTQSLSICVQVNIRSSLVTESVSEFMRKNPAIAVRFEFCDIIDMTNAVSQRHYDLYVSNMEDLAAGFAGLEVHELERVGFSFLVKRGFMGIRTPPESPAVYAGCDFIDPYCSPGSASTLARRSALPLDYRLGWINSFGLFPGRVLNMPNWQSVLAAVEFGLGVTLITDDVEITHPEEYFRIPVRKTAAIMAIQHSDNRNPALADFLKILKAKSGGN